MLKPTSNCVLGSSQSSTYPSRGRAVLTDRGGRVRKYVSGCDLPAAFLGKEGVLAPSGLGG